MSAATAANFKTFSAQFYGSTGVTDTVSVNLALYGSDQDKGWGRNVLSGNDMTALEFRNVVEGSRGWQSLLADARVTQRHLESANHTFARREWRDEVAAYTEQWLKSW